MTTEEDDHFSWEDAAIEKGFELDHGCSVLFDLFHNCSCIFLDFYFKLVNGLFFYFLAVKGRFRDYYRYGQVRSCMPYWNDFFLCMRLKMETDESKARVFV